MTDDEDVPDHYERYDCECGWTTYATPRAEESALGIACSECGKQLAGGQDD